VIEKIATEDNFPERPKVKKREAICVCLCGFCIENFTCSLFLRCRMQIFYFPNQRMNKRDNWICFYAEFGIRPRINFLKD